jgi:diamine N-acetyltransferase
MTIRKADLNDVETIQKLAFGIIPEYYADIVPHELNLFFVNTYQTAQAIQTQLSNSYDYYLLSDNGVMIGYLSIKINTEKSEMILSKLYLLKTYRGSGYGQKVMGFIINQATELNLAKISLLVNRNNQKAIRFYTKYDFAITQELENKFENGYTFLDYEMVRVNF